MGSDVDQLQREIDAIYAYRDDWMRVTHRGRIDLFRALLYELLERGAFRRIERALDIGCNAGLFSKLISDAGFRHVLGIDVAQGDIDCATQKFAFRTATRDLSFSCTRAEDLVPTTRFDLILCTEVIEHTERPDLVVQKIKDLLAPNGIAIVSLPNAMSLPCLVSFLSRKVRGRPIDPNLRSHLSYPVFRSLRIFEPDLERIDCAGVNLFWNERSLKLARQRSLFDPLNRASAILSRRSPLRYVSQFLFLVLKKPGPKRSFEPGPWRKLDLTTELSVLVACHGNICRSPLAQGQLEKRLRELERGGRIRVDSAAITHLTRGRCPHPLAVACARSHGLSIEALRARPFEELDFDRFDRIFVMDRQNQADLLQRARSPR